MWVKFTQRNTGLFAFTCLSRNSAARAAISSSMFSIRFLVKRPGIFDLLGPVRVRKAVNDTARTEILAEIWEFRIAGFRIVGKFRFLLGIEVIEIAVELV